VLGQLPFDPAAAAVANGEHGSARRLSRSMLVSSAFRVGEALRDEMAPSTDPGSQTDLEDRLSRDGSSIHPIQKGYPGRGVLTALAKTRSSRSEALRNEMSSEGQLR
jgi:hypothetical protein